MNVQPVPEIDVSSALTALSFIISIALLMWERRRFHSAL
jgi:hypothetical protein